MDTEAKKNAYHTAAYSAAGETLMSFDPINAIHQHICAFHPYAYEVFIFSTAFKLTLIARHDFTRQVEAHHFCTHVSEHLHQCIIYDSDKADAKLIGIEYIVTEDVRRRNICQGYVENVKRCPRYSNRCQRTRNTIGTPTNTK